MDSSSASTLFVLWLEPFVSLGGVYTDFPSIDEESAVQALAARPPASLSSPSSSSSPPRSSSPSRSPSHKQQHQPDDDIIDGTAHAAKIAAEIEFRVRQTFLDLKRHSTLALSYCQEGKYEEFLDALFACLRIRKLLYFPSDPSYQHALKHLAINCNELAVVRAKKGNLPRAFELLKMADELAKDVDSLQDRGALRAAICLNLSNLFFKRMKADILASYSEEAFSMWRFALDVESSADNKNSDNHYLKQFGPLFAYQLAAARSILGKHSEALDLLGDVIVELSGDNQHVTPSAFGEDNIVTPSSNVTFTVILPTPPESPLRKTLLYAAYHNISVSLSALSKLPEALSSANHSLVMAERVLHPDSRYLKHIIRTRGILRSLISQTKPLPDVRSGTGRTSRSSTQPLPPPSSKRPSTQKSKQPQQQQQRQQRESEYEQPQESSRLPTIGRGSGPSRTTSPSPLLSNRGGGSRAAVDRARSRSPTSPQSRSSLPSVSHHQRHYQQQQHQEENNPHGSPILAMASIVEHVDPLGREQNLVAGPEGEPMADGLIVKNALESGLDADTFLRQLNQAHFSPPTSPSHQNLKPVTKEDQQQQQPQHHQHQEQPQQEEAEEQQAQAAQQQPQHDEQKQEELPIPHVEYHHAPVVHRAQAEAEAEQHQPRELIEEDINVISPQKEKQERIAEEEEILDEEVEDEVKHINQPRAQQQQQQQQQQDLQEEEEEEVVDEEPKGNNENDDGMIAHASFKEEFVSPRDAISPANGYRSQPRGRALPTPVPSKSQQQQQQTKPAPPRSNSSISRKPPATAASSKPAAAAPPSTSSASSHQSPFRRRFQQAAEEQQQKQQQQQAPPKTANAVSRGRSVSSLATKPPPTAAAPATKPSDNSLPSRRSNQLSPLHTRSSSRSSSLPAAAATTLPAAVQKEQKEQKAQSQSLSRSQSVAAVYGMQSTTPLGSSAASASQQLRPLRSSHGLSSPSPSPSNTTLLSASASSKSLSKQTSMPSQPIAPPQPPAAAARAQLVYGAHLRPSTKTFTPLRSHSSSRPSAPSSIAASAPASTQPIASSLAELAAVPQPLQEQEEEQEQEQQPVMEEPQAQPVEPAQPQEEPLSPQKKDNQYEDEGYETFEDDGDGEEQSEEEKKKRAAAAVRIQASYRGHKMRNNKDALFAQKRAEQGAKKEKSKSSGTPAATSAVHSGKDEEAAAVAIQSQFRGYKTRKSMAEKKKSQQQQQQQQQKHQVHEQEPVDEQSNRPAVQSGKDEEAAAVSIQAQFRGYKTRKSMAEKKKQQQEQQGQQEQNLKQQQQPIDEESNRAAVRIQAQFRGHRIRVRKNDLFEEKKKQRDNKEKILRDVKEEEEKEEAKEQEAEAVAIEEPAAVEEKKSVDDDDSQKAAVLIQTQTIQLNLMSIRKQREALFEEKRQLKDQKQNQKMAVEYVETVIQEILAQLDAANSNSSKKAEEEKAAIEIQAAFRGHQVRKNREAIFEQKKNAKAASSIVAAE